MNLTLQIPREHLANVRHCKCSNDVCSTIICCACIYERLYAIHASLCASCARGNIKRTAWRNSRVHTQYTESRCYGSAAGGRSLTWLPPTPVGWRDASIHTWYLTPEFVYSSAASIVNDLLCIVESSYAADHFIERIKTKWEVNDLLYETCLLLLRWTKKREWLIFVWNFN